MGPGPGRYFKPKPVVDDERRGDLAKLRSLKVQQDVEARRAEGTGNETSVFEHSLGAGLTRPISGAVAAMSPWAYGYDTTMGERYQGAVDAYDAEQNRHWEEHPYLSAGQSMAGGLLGGGAPLKAAKAAPWLAETAYDAGTGAMQTAAEGGSLRDILADAAINAAMGGTVTGYGKSQQVRKDLLRRR